MNDFSKLIFIYTQTCSHGNSIGCFYLPLGYIATDMDSDTSDIIDALDDCQENGLILYDPCAEWVMIRNFFMTNDIKNIKHAIGCVRAALLIYPDKMKLEVGKELLKITQGKYNPSDEALKRSYDGCMSELEEEVEKLTNEVEAV